MWKFQHLDGQREINELHVPVGRAGEADHDVRGRHPRRLRPGVPRQGRRVPGRYTHLWFEPTKPGRYHLFCAEYCGTRHSGMIGQVVVMEPSEYQAWLSGGAPEGSLASAGAKLFADLACNTCHRPDAQGRGPVLEELFGKTRALQNGETVVVDEAYLRESILQPGRQDRGGFQPIMPTFQGLVSEEELLELIEYIKSLKALPQVPTRSSSNDRVTTVLMPPRHYLNDGYGIKSWLLTRDHKRIGAALPRGDHAVLLHRRRVRRADPPRAGDAGRRPGDRRDLQQAVHDARRDDGVLLPDPVDSGRARQLPRADHDRREGSRVSEAEPGELVHLHDRRRSSRSTRSSPAASTPAGRSTRRSAPCRRPPT